MHGSSLRPDNPREREQLHDFFFLIVFDGTFCEWSHVQLDCLDHKYGDDNSHALNHCVNTLSEAFWWIVKLWIVGEGKRKL